MENRDGHQDNDFEVQIPIDDNTDENWHTSARKTFQSLFMLIGLLALFFVIAIICTNGEILPWVKN